MKILMTFFVLITISFLTYIILIIILRYRNLKTIKKSNIIYERKVLTFLNYLKDLLIKLNKNFAGFKRYEKIKLLIERLNLKRNISNEEFMFFEEILIFVFFLISYLLFENIILSLIFALAGYFLPEIILKEKVKHKDKKILKEMPDAMDIISANIEGGLSLLKAISKYVEKNKNDFSDELVYVLKNVNLGKSFSESLLEMNKKINLKEITGLVNALIQADKFGGNIKEIIRAQADELRTKRFLELKKRAYETPVKLLIPLVIFIFPVVFIVLFGPVIIKLLSGM